METDDLCKLLDTNEESLVRILEERYLTNRIYTSAGIVLISINPYINLDLYGSNIMNAYFNSFSCDPHIYSVCENAFHDKSIADQTIMISGESGSGKTENTKLLQDYLIVRTKTSNTIKEKIDSLTVILESFGNAKTVLNDNSSRVGKMISYYIDGTIQGIKVNTFLLEKSRVTHQNKGECNFNIFYELCTYKKLKIQNDYINTKDKIRENYKNIKKAMESLGFTNIEFIENILLVILNFGFMQFKYKNNEICINDIKIVDYICKTLKIEPSFLESVLLKKEIRVSNETLIKYNTIEEAITIRDSISRILYVKIFDLIVGKINETLSVPKGHCINILDIFGFEVFKENSLDQLCINYANEKIQEDFIKKIFESKQEEYKIEIENYTQVPFNSNSKLIYELEKRCGLFDLIDEESKNKFGSIDNLKNKITSYIKKGIKTIPQDKILITHFIKDVEYNLKDFICKNREVKINKLIFGEFFNETVSNTTVLSSFLQSLKNLFAIINSTQIKYIRCIKPNNNKSNTFDKKIVYDQLVSTGILEVIKISKQIYTYEMNKQEWYSKYDRYKKVLEGKTKVFFNMDVKIGIEAVEKMKELRKRKIFDWFMAKLLEKKEGLNNLNYIIQDNTLDIKEENLFNEKEKIEIEAIEMCEIRENDKKDYIKFLDYNLPKNPETLDSIMNIIFRDDNVEADYISEEQEIAKINVIDEKINENIEKITDQNILQNELNEDVSLDKMSEEVHLESFATDDKLEQDIIELQQDDNLLENSKKYLNEGLSEQKNELKEDTESFEDLNITNVESIENEKEITPKDDESVLEPFNEENDKLPICRKVCDQEGSLIIDKNSFINIDVLSPESYSTASTFKQDTSYNSYCDNCTNLELKYKFVSEALREANEKLSQMYSSNILHFESASDLFSRLFYIYLENIPSQGSVPKFEILSFAHSAFLISKKTNKIIRESALIFVEEISLRIKHFDKNISHLLFFLSNLIEYSKLVVNIRDLQDIIRKLYLDLTEYYQEKIKEFIPFSITEYQELSNFKCNDSFIKKLFKPNSVHKLVKVLELINEQMNFYYLDKEYKTSILNYLLGTINTSVFNNLIIKNNFLSFNRCIQINYNVNQIFNFLCKINILEGRDNFKEILEIIKLVNMTSSSDINWDTIRDEFETLTDGQIATFLLKMGFEYKKEKIKETVFITCEPPKFIELTDKIEENFVIPRFIPTDELKFLFK